MSSESTRREFLASGAAAGTLVAEQKPIKLFTCDFNWTCFDKPFRNRPPSTASDWAFVNPKEYFDWHCEFGSNAIFCHAYTFCGYAFYPTDLGPVAPGPGRDLLPSLFGMARRAGLPFWSYFSVNIDLTLSNQRYAWILPKSREFVSPHGCFAPESPWTDLLCARVEEFLRLYPVDWLLFDSFVYGSMKPDFPIQPARYVKRPFEEIIGRAMPERADQITPAEGLKYKRAVMARQFHRIRDTVRKTSPGTRICFNAPYWKAGEALWADHPMMAESDLLFAESTDEVVSWLLGVRKPHQRVMTTVIGRVDGSSDPNTWRKWHRKGCDFFGYAFGTPPDFRPHPSYRGDLEVIRRAFREIQ